jgi:triosephosphate isomerase (TIM)
MSKKLVVANWKMNPGSLKEAEVLAKSIAMVAKKLPTVDTVICPPFPFLGILKNIKSKKIHLGVQNIASEPLGAHTGEVAASMLASFKVSYVIIGHSERRAMGETNQIVNAKITQALRAKMIPIVCVGETVRDAHGLYLGFLKGQLHESLHGITKAQMKNIIIAYEPIWAISSNHGRRATPEEFTEVSIFIRKTLSDMYDVKCAHSTIVLYGGSVGSDDVRSFIIEGGADGVLVGHASLSAKKFTDILTVCNTK